MYKEALVVLIALMLLAPLLPSESAAAGGHDPARPELPYVKSTPRNEDAQWWDVTSMDSDRNRIFDELDLELGVRDGRFELYVDYAHEPTDSDVEALERMGIEVTGVFYSIDCIGLANVPASVVPQLALLDGVVMVEPKRMPIPLSDIQTPTVKARGSKEYSPRTAWELNYTGRGMTIAIMDTGIDDEHPSFNPSGWSGPKRVAGVDFTRPELLAPRDGTDDPDDINGHGTTCAGISTGTGAPEEKYMGAAPSAKLIDLRIGTAAGASPGEGPFGFMYDAAIEATEWAVAHAHDQWPGQGAEYYGIDVLSLSWGIPWEGSSDGSDAYSRALNQLEEAGTVVVVAAGNDGPDNAGITGMGAADKVITVGATDDQDTINRTDDFIAEYSSRGPRDDDGDGYPYDELKPEISSPGTGITQAEYSRIGDASSNGYGSRGSGTSYATPNVAGIVALVLEANQNLTPVMVKEVVKASAERRGEPTVPELDPFWSKDYGWGIADAYRAVRMAELVRGSEQGIDVELQCYIMNHSLSGDGSTLYLAGISWSRAGDVEGVEVRLDGGEWLAVDSISEDQFAQWEVEVDVSGLGPGNHTVEARSVSSETSSLYDFIEVGLATPATEEGASSAGIGPAAGLLAILVLAVVGYAVYKKKVPFLSRGRPTAGAAGAEAGEPAKASGDA